MIWSLPGDPDSTCSMSSYKIRVPGLWAKRYRLTDAYTWKKKKWDYASWPKLFRCVTDNNKKTYRGCGWSARAQSWWHSPVWRQWWRRLFPRGTKSWLSRCHRFQPGLTPRQSDFHGLSPRYQPVPTGRYCQTPEPLSAPLRNKQREKISLHLDATKAKVFISSTYPIQRVGKIEKNLFFFFVMDSYSL